MPRATIRDVQRAALEGEAVRPIEPRVERLDLAFPALVDDWAFTLIALLPELVCKQACSRPLR
jgi:hypothetical protein